MDDERFSGLSEGQRDALRRVFRHQGSKEIARDRGTTKWAVDQQIARAVQKLGAQNRIHAAQLLAEHEGRDTSYRIVSDSVGIGGPTMSSASPVAHQSDERVGSASEAAREERSLYGVPATAPARAMLTFPFGAAGGTPNDLSLRQRIGWILAIPLVIAVAFGMLATGLKVLADLIWSIFGTAH